MEGCDMNDRSKKEAEILRNRRKELGLTQMETAMKAGIVLHVSSIINHTNPRQQNRTDSRQ